MNKSLIAFIDANINNLLIVTSFIFLALFIWVFFIDTEEEENESIQNDL